MISTCQSCFSGRLCKDIQNVSDVAVGIKTTSEQRVVAASLGTLIKWTMQVKQTKENDLKRVTAQKDTAVNRIEERVSDNKQRLDDLKAVAITEVDVKFSELEQTIAEDINRSDDVIYQLEEEDKRMKVVDVVGESDFFVCMKQTMARIREDKNVVQKMEATCGESLHVTIDDTIHSCVTGLDSFAKIGRPTELALSIERRPTVRMYDDQNECLITDCCFLDNGTMLLADYENYCIKLFDASYKALGRCALQGHPTAVCVVGVGEVAITIYDKKVVQFANVDPKICLTGSFSVGEYCRGVSYSDNRLFVSCGGGIGESLGQVRIYDKSGTRVQKIKNGSMDMPRHIMATTDGGCIMANRERGVLGFNNKGKIVWTFTHLDLKHARGLCEVDDWLLIGCFKNGHVFSVNPADKNACIILRGSTELKKLRSLKYDMCNDKLIVMKESCDYMLVYKISRK